MTTSTSIQQKANELGISSEMMSCALQIIYQNRNLVNAIDNSNEMDDYIYRAILKNAFEKRKVLAEKNLYADDNYLQNQAAKDLTMMRREELTSHAFYRAVLPLMVKVLHHEPILRLHAEEASEIVLQLANVKRKHRTTSITEIIVKKCVAEIESYQENSFVI